MRMLEREFGGKGGPKDEGEAETMVGCIDQRGRLITQGPKKRLAVRWVQALLALTAAISSIYAALVRVARHYRSRILNFCFSDIFRVRCTNITMLTQPL